MNKQELIKGMAQKTGATQIEAKKFLEAFLETATEGLQEEGKLQIVGFANFEIKETKERNGFNPSTQEPMVIPAGKRIQVRISEKLKEQVL